MEDKHTSIGIRFISVVRQIFIYILSIGIIVAAVLFAVNQSPSKSIFGYRYYTVLTPSMEPHLSVGDLILVKVTDADQIQVGDVITFNPSSESDAYLTHRVTEKIEDYEGTGTTCFHTKGDANDVDDSFLIDEDRVIGIQTVCIPKLGYIIRFAQLRWYFVVPLLVLLFVFLHLLGVYTSSEDDNGDADITDEEEGDAQGFGKVK